MDQLNLFLIKLSILLSNDKFPNVNSATYDHENPSGGWLANEIKNALTSLSGWFAKGLVTILDPFLTWGMRIAILICIIIYFVGDGDKKILTKGMACFFILIVFTMIKGAVT